MSGLRFGGIWNGAGTWDALASEPPFDVYVQKTVTLEPRAGNPEPTIFRDGPRMWRNRVGLRNPGLVRYLEEVVPELQLLGTPVVASCLGYSDGEWAILLSALAAQGFAAIELNLSCPNTAACEDPVAEMRYASQLELPDIPLIAKLSPTVDLATIRSVAEYADALTLTNSLPSPRGGHSGMSVHQPALQCVAYAAESTDVPIIGLGGVVDIPSYGRMRDAGAWAVGVGAANLDGPEVAQELRSYIASEEEAA